MFTSKEQLLNVFISILAARNYGWMDWLRSCKMPAMQCLVNTSESSLTDKLDPEVWKSIRMHLIFWVYWNVENSSSTIESNAQHSRAVQPPSSKIFSAAKTFIMIWETRVDVPQTNLPELLPFDIQFTLKGEETIVVITGLFACREKSLITYLRFFSHYGSVS